MPIASTEAIGRLSCLFKDLVDQVVSNRDPHGRADCTLEFSAIYSYLGGLAAGPLLRTIVNVLISLSKHGSVIAKRFVNAFEASLAPSEFCDRYKDGLEDGGVIEGGEWERVEQACTAFGLALCQCV